MCTSCVYLCQCMRVCIYACVRVYMCICIPVYLYTCVYQLLCVCTNLFVLFRQNWKNYVYVYCVHVHMCMCVCIGTQCIHVYTDSLCLDMSVCMCISRFTCTQLSWMLLFLCMLACIYPLVACMRVCVCACVCVSKQKWKMYTYVYQLQCAPTSL